MGTVPSIIIGLGCEHTVTQEKKMMNKQISIYITCLCFICTGHTPEVCKYMLQDIFWIIFWIGPWFLSWRQNIYGDDEICIISDLNGEITKAQLVQEVALQFCNWYKAGGRGKEAAQKSNFKINRHKSIEIRINYNFQFWKKPWSHSNFIFW